MKIARLALAALVAALGGLVLMTTQPASGQGRSDRPIDTPSVTPSGYNHYGDNREVGRWYLGSPSGGSSDPELNKLLGVEGNLERETAGLVEEYARTEDEAQRSKTKAKLAATLEKQFDQQQKRRDLEVARIEAQLKKLREIMRKRAESRQTIVDKRLDQLLREADGLGWTPPHGTASPRNALFSTGQPQQR